MIRRVESEIKILGINFFMIMVSFAIALIVLSAIAGELLNFYPVSFEVIFPFFVSMVVGEWGRTRADSNFDIIAAQSKSLFCWVLGRYILIFGVSSVFAFSAWYFHLFSDTNCQYGKYLSFIFPQHSFCRPCVRCWGFIVPGSMLRLWLAVLCG